MIDERLGALCYKIGEQDPQVQDVLVQLSIDDKHCTIGQEHLNEFRHLAYD
jgi:hypothetical protein